MIPFLRQTLLFTFLMTVLSLGWSQLHAQTILSEDLRSGVLPEGWTATDMEFRTSAGGYALFGSDTSILETTIIDLSGLESATLSYSVAKFGSGDDGPLKIEVSIDGGSNWNAQVLDSQTPTSSTYINETINLDAAVVGQSQVAIRFSRPDSPTGKRLRDVVVAGPEEEQLPEPTVVSTLAELRAGTADGTARYKVSGEVLLTHYDTFRNRRYVQDSSAGIFIEDEDGLLPTTFTTPGQGVTGMEGTLAIVNGGALIRFTPDEGSANAVITSSDNPITPEEKNISDITLEDTGKLIKISTVSFAETGTFSTGTNYTLTDGTNAFTFRTDYFGADYINAAIPVGELDVVGYVGGFGEAAQITARSSEDFQTGGTDPGIISVGTLADLRAGTADGTTRYKVTGEVLLNHYDTFRNRRYVQDSSAGIFIEDQDGLLPSEFSTPGQGLTGMVGTLAVANQGALIRFTPDEGSVDAVITSTGNTITPETFTIPDITLDDTGKLGRIENVSFVETGTFSTGTNYTIQDANSNTFTFRTDYWSADYIDTPIPTETFTVIGFIGGYADSPQITARSSADFEGLSEPEPEVTTITINNVGSSAWVFTSIEGDGASATLNEENTTLTIAPGARLEFVNNGGTMHPLDFRDANDNILLAQGSLNGSFETDADVNYEEDGNIVRFTVSDALGQLIASYFCTAHYPMNGTIILEGNEPVVVPEIVDGGSYTQDFAAFDAVENLPDGWTVTNDNYGGDWGTGTSSGLRGNSSVLGFQHTSSSGVFSASVSLLNSTGSTLEAIEVSYLGKVERRSEGRSPEWTVTVDGVEVPGLFYSTADTVETVQTAVVSGLSVADGETVTIAWSSDRGGPSGASKQIGISDVSVSATEAPELPAPLFSLGAGSYIGDQTVFVSNFDAYGSGVSIYYTLDGSTPGGSSTLYNNSTGIFIEDGNGTVTLTAAATDGASFGQSTSVTYQLPTNVASIADLRDQATGSVYRVTSEMTFIGGTGFRNTKFFQDSSGQGIQVDDAPNGLFNPGVILTEYAIGDNITSLVGTLGRYQGQLQLGVLEDPGAPLSSGNEVTPVTRTLSELSDDDQSRLVKVVGVEFQEAGGTFGGGGSLTPIKDPSLQSFSSNFRNVFGESDITSAEIPSGAVTITGIIQENSAGKNLAARSLADISTGDTGGPTTVSASYIAGWNMVSLPLIQQFGDYTDLFPNALASTLYEFTGSYNLASTLESGTGYWLNMSQAGDVTFEGDPVEQEILTLSDGWNLIGSVTADASITDTDDIVLPGTTFGFNGTYVETSVIEPGQGYWVATSGPGQVTIESAGSALSGSTSHQTESLINTDSFAKITFTGELSGEAISRDLYFAGEFENEVHKLQKSLPPVPPTGSFDARIHGGFWISAETAVSVTLQQSDSPVRLELSGLELANVKFFANGDLLAKKQWISGEILDVPQQADQILIDAEAGLADEIPAQVQLDQNYPNPFNPATSIRFGLPEASDVRLDVYNVLGQRVASLLNENRSAGFHTVSFDAGNLSSGMYLYRLQAGDVVQIRQLTLVK